MHKNHAGPNICYDGKLVHPEKMRELDVGNLKVCYFFLVWAWRVSLSSFLS